MAVHEDFKLSLITSTIAGVRYSYECTFYFDLFIVFVTFVVDVIEKFKFIFKTSFLSQTISH